MNGISEIIINNALSISVVFLYAIPISLYYWTGNFYNIIALLGIISTTSISEFLKYNIIKNWSVRPKGAIDCNLWCTDGNQAGQPGMPSSHSATVAFFATFYFQKVKSILIRTALILYALFVMYSRYKKRCHSISQIGTGATLGFILAQVAVRQL